MSELNTPLSIKPIGTWVSQEIVDKNRSAIGVVYGEKVAAELVRRANLFDDMKEYVRHSEGCSAAHGDQYRCRCGYRELAALLRDCESETNQ